MFGDLWRDFLWQNMCFFTDVLAELPNLQRWGEDEQTVGSSVGVASGVQNFGTNRSASRSRDAGCEPSRKLRIILPSSSSSSSSPSSSSSSSPSPSPSRHLLMMYVATICTSIPIAWSAGSGSSLPAANSAAVQALREMAKKDQQDNLLTNREISHRIL